MGLQACAKFRGEQIIGSPLRRPRAAKIAVRPKVLMDQKCLVETARHERRGGNDRTLSKRVALN